MFLALVWLAITLISASLLAAWVLKFLRLSSAVRASAQMEFPEGYLDAQPETRSDVSNEVGRCGDICGLPRTDTPLRGWRLLATWVPGIQLFLWILRTAGIKLGILDRLGLTTVVKATDRQNIAPYSSPAASAEPHNEALSKSNAVGISIGGAQQDTRLKAPQSPQPRSLISEQTVHSPIFPWRVDDNNVADDQLDGLI